jgi:DNA-binding IclR family transcriptional regulator
MLASVDPRARGDLLGPEPYHTSAGGGTTIDRAAVDRDIDLTLERGYALSLDEVADGLSGVAAPIRLAEGRTIGCISISGASRNFDAQFTERLARAVRQTTELFSFATAEMAAVARFLGY